MMPFLGDIRDDRYVYNWDDETEPDPELDGMSWEQIKGILDYYEQEYENQRWQEQLQYAFEYQQWLEENGWYRD